MADPALKPEWRERFAFFEPRGPPGSPKARAALKALRSGKRRLVNISWLGFFFGPIYFLVLGMWRRALALIGAVLIGLTADVIEIAAASRFRARLTRASLSHCDDVCDELLLLPEAGDEL